MAISSYTVEESWVVDSSLVVFKSGCCTHSNAALDANTIQGLWLLSVLSGVYGVFCYLLNKNLGNTFLAQWCVTAGLICIFPLAYL